MQDKPKGGGEPAKVIANQHENADLARKQENQNSAKDGFKGGSDNPKRRRVESAGQKARSLRRLLDYKKDLPDDVREKMQMTAESLQLQHRERMRTVKREKFIRTKKALYSKLKFYELKKVQRRLQQTRKQLACSMQDQQGSSLIPGLKDLLRKHLDDLNYIRLYPPDEPYIALFPTKDTDESRMKREAMRQRIRELLIKTRLGEAQAAEDAGAADDLFLERNDGENAFENAPSVSDDELGEQQLQPVNEGKEDPSRSKKYGRHNPKGATGLPHERQRAEVRQPISGGRSKRGILKTERKIPPLKANGFQKEEKMDQLKASRKRETLASSETELPNRDAVKPNRIGLSRHKAPNQHLIFNSDSE